MRRALLGAALIVTWSVAAALPAGAAQPSWSGEYSVKRFAATKTGTSLAARQWEPDFADTYTFETDCSSGTCVATVIDGPAPANPTLPQPARYTWDGTSWVHPYDWQWDCWQGEGVPKVWAPAHSVAYYTPQPDGTLVGSWRTDIASGPCEAPSIRLPDRWAAVAERAIHGPPRQAASERYGGPRLDIGGRNSASRVRAHHAPLSRCSSRVVNR